MLFIKDLFRSKDTNLLRGKEWKKIFPENSSQKRIGVAILISDKIDFKTEIVTRDKNGQYIIIKGTIYQEDITMINIYAPNIRAPKHIEQLLKT